VLGCDRPVACHHCDSLGPTLQHVTGGRKGDTRIAVETAIPGRPHRIKYPRIVYVLFPKSTTGRRILLALRQGEQEQVVARDLPTESSGELRNLAHESWR
jgi:hypothetical protein